MTGRWNLSPEDFDVCIRVFVNKILLRDWNFLTAIENDMLILPEDKGRHDG
jgi:hypothetical protein